MIIYDKKTKDFILDKLKEEMRNFLAQDGQRALPFSIRMLTACISKFGNLEPLTYIKSMMDFMHVLQNSCDKSAPIPHPREALFAGLRSMHENKRWSDEDRNEFYTVSANILKASPRLFVNCLELMENLDAKTLKEFSQSIYPLYHAQVIFAENPPQAAIERPFDAKKIVRIRKDIRTFAEHAKEGTASLTQEKGKAVSRLVQEFKDLFGITAIPEQFTQEDSRSLLNMILYGAHLAGRTPEREAILGYYLALMLNGKWETFRQGTSVDSTGLLTPEKAALVTPIIEQWKTSSMPSPELLGIDEATIGPFVKAMQTETRALLTGNVQTIDTQLGNFTANLRELTDPDLYPDTFDRERMKLLHSHQPEYVTKTVAALFQAQSDPSKARPLSPEEQEIKAQIETMCTQRGIAMSPDTLKKHFQEEMRPFAVIAQLLYVINEEKVDQRIDALRASLQPPDQIIAIFQRLGEEFKQGSGAYALSHDLDYLESLIVKKERELSEEEKQMVSKYIEQIREELIDLERIYDGIKDQFRALEKIQASLRPPLDEKIAELGKIITAGTESFAIASIATNDLNAIIENIRECLSCRSSKGSNNDTNLTFGEPTKFFVYSTAEGMRKGSIADQVVYFFPTKREQGQKEYAFVLDRIYGMKSATVLANHIRVMLKKMEALHTRFPDARLSLCIPQGAVSSVATSFEHLSRVLAEHLGENFTLSAQGKITLTVTPSPLGDHYLEIGGDAKNTGDRIIEGVFIIRSPLSPAPGRVRRIEK